MARLRQLIHEIHRRSLWQVLAIYLVGAWIGYEVVQAMTEGLGLPDWFPAFAVVLFIVGLPVVLATAFVQEGGPRVSRRAETGLPTIELARSDEKTEAAAAAGPTSPRQLFTWRNAITGGVLAFALWGVIATGWIILGMGSDSESAAIGRAVDPNVVAVFPFRVGGADPAVEYLGEGMVDLLAAKLTGEGGPRAVDPRAVVSAWRRAVATDVDFTEAEALEVARSLGAGRALLGGLVGNPNRIVLNASLIGVPGGRTGAQASVEGATDSLTTLVDQLTAQLLAREAGEAQQRLAALTSTSLPALRAYLDGQAAYRRGGFAAAGEHFAQAIDLDSTFALAALGLVAARFWTANVFDPGGIRVAWTHRDRLSARDRAGLIAYAGPRYPRAPSSAERLAAAERAVEAAPDRPEASYFLGEIYYHQGPALGLTNAHQLADDAFGRAVELDSAFSPPLSHLVDLAVLKDDKAALERLGPLYLEVDSVGDFRDYLHWEIAVALGDSATADSLRTHFPSMSTLGLRAVIRQSELRGVASQDVELAAAVLRGRTGTRAERWGTLLLLHDMELNGGRPSQALAITDALEQVQPRPRFHLRIRVLDGLYGGGDPDAAVQAAQELASHASAPLSDRVEERAFQYADICAVEQWRLWHGDLDAADRSIAQLRSASFPRDSSATVSFASLCATLLDALLAELQARPDADALLAQLDSLMRTDPEGSYGFENLVVAHLHEAQGDLAAAHESLRRRVYFFTRYLSTYLREEGRLAALIGDTDAAIEAYRHYLALRDDPEPALAGEVARVRSELAKLTGESGP